MTNRPSERLRLKLELAAPVYMAAAERLWVSPRVRELYPVYLATMHMVVRAAVPLLLTARERARERSKIEPGCARVLGYLNRQIQREAGHDQWLLEDLAATGADPTIPTTAIPSPKVAALVGAQYFWINHHHPLALLGHIAALEAYPPPPGFAARIQAQTGLPREAFRMLERHELHEWTDATTVFDVLDELPLSPRHETLIGISALYTIQAGVELLEEIHDRVFTPRS